MRDHRGIILLQGLDKGGSYPFEGFEAFQIQHVTNGPDGSNSDPPGGSLGRPQTYAQRAGVPQLA